MTKQETLELLKRLSIHFPAFYKSPEVAEEWRKEFADVEAAKINEAVGLFIRSNSKNYLPTIARIRECLPKRRPTATTATRYWTIDYDDNDQPYIRKIKYFVRQTKSGTQWIEDEDGYIFSDPNDTVQNMLLSRVRSTGAILSETEAFVEKEMLQKKLDRRAEVES